MGYRTPQHRPARQGRHDLHRQLRRAELHRRPGGVHHRPERVPHRLDQGRAARRRSRAAARRIPTIAELLRPLGYATGQFGKNHLGDKDEFLPTEHGFDEFFGNLYHLNAEEEPEQRDYPKEQDYPDFRKNFGPRGVLDCKANAGMARQTIEDTGPLTKKRMETIDDEIRRQAKDFIDRQDKADKPFFVWLNSTQMHFRTHPKPESLGQSGRWQSEYHDAMIDHDKWVGEVLRAARRARHRRQHHRHLLHRQRPAHELLAGCRHDAVPQREELQLGRRIPRALAGALARRHASPAASATRSSRTSTGCRRCWPPPARPDIKEKLLAGYQAGGKTFKVHLDGYNFLPYFKGEAEKSPRVEYFYFSDDGDLMAFRYDNWKIVFLEQRVAGTLQIWAEPIVATAGAQAVQSAHRSLRARRHHLEHLFDWMIDHIYLFVPAQRSGLAPIDLVLDEINLQTRNYYQPAPKHARRRGRAEQSDDRWDGAERVVRARHSLLG